MYNNSKLCLIGLRGLAGAGKDTVGKYLIDNHGFKKIAFADPLKEICSIISGWPLPLLNGDNKEYRDQRETLVHPIYKKTPRQLLQFVGTDLFRDQLDPNIWVNIIENRINDSISSINTNGSEDMSSSEVCIVITDIRFPNEAQLIQKYGGHIIRVTREQRKVKESESGLLDTTPHVHISEQPFPIEHEIILKNNGTIEELYRSIQNLIDNRVIVI